VCSQPFEAQGHRNEDNTGAEDSTLASYIAQSRIELTFGNPFKPMLSAKTSFARCLTDISSRHRQFVKQLDETSPVAKSLSFKYPVFSAETKLDGERMLAHISRDGTVRIHSRAGNWYRYSVSPSREEHSTNLATVTSTPPFLHLQSAGLSQGMT